MGQDKNNLGRYIFAVAVSLFIGLILIGCRGLNGGDLTQATTPTTPTTPPTPTTPVTPPPPPPPPPGSLTTSVNHIVIMLQENHSFDNYFGKLNDYRVANGLPADVDGIPAGVSDPNFSKTANIAPYHLITACTENPSPSWNESHADINRDAPNTEDPTNPATMLMNGFPFSAGTDSRANGTPDTEGVRSMGYYTQNELPYYYFMATQFATSDRWFSPAPTRTQPNRLYLLSATSAGRAYPPTTVSTQTNIFQLLQNAGISWKVYVTDPNGTYLNNFSAFAQAHQANIVPISQYFTDIQAGTLPSVALIESGYESGRDEHAPGSVQVGAAYAASIINPLLTSPSWKDTIFFLSFDEGGGFYDHVPPMAAVNPDGIPPQDLRSTDIKGDFNMTGFRVPLIVISPFTKKGFVSHSNADYTALLKFIEVRFNLPALTKRDAAQPDMQEYFDFTAVPWSTPPSPPAQPTNAPCYLDHLP